MTAKELMLKLEKKLHKSNPEFLDSVNGMGVKELEDSMEINGRHAEDVKLAKSEDLALNDAKEQVKELSAPYNESLKILKDKITFLHLMIKDKKGEI